MSRLPPAPAVVVLDFDGVLCDSLDECVRIAWAAHEGRPAQAFVAVGAEGVPDAVVERFRRWRPYMRSLEHFLVAIVDDGEPPADNPAFAARHAALAPAQVQAFVTAALAYRAEVRTYHRRAWLAHHRVQQRLARLATVSYLATARDRASVREIMGAHGVRLASTRVFHSLSEKVPALETIAGLESVQSEDVGLVDDSVANCIAARGAGYGALWASWGYSAPGDPALAAEHDIPVLTVDGLLALVAR